jgi:ATP-dependent Lon protease
MKQATDRRIREVLDAPSRRAFLDGYYEQDFDICKRLEIGGGS